MFIKKYITFILFILVLVDLQSPNELYQSRTDAKVPTCVDHNELYRITETYVDAYMTNLSIIAKLDGGLVTAHFNQTVDCEKRSVRNFTVINTGYGS